MKISQILESRDSCSVCGQTPCNCTHIMESTGSVGDTVRELYQQIYDQGDDALEYLNTQAPLFAQYWDQYEGDIESIIAELSPKNLIRIAQELKAVAGAEGLTEFAPPGGDDGEPNEEILRKLAAQWWNGTEQQMARAQQALEAMGWEIGPDESGDEDAGVYVYRIGDDDGRDTIAFGHSELELNEGGTGSGRPAAGAWDTSLGQVGRVEKTAQGIRHHADPSRYGGSETEPELDRLDKNKVNAMDKALGVKWDRESKRYYSPIKVDEGETPEKELERLKLRQNAEHGRASLQRQAETQARIRELEKQVKDQQGVAEGTDERKQNALWAQITAHEKAAKQSKDLKQQHHLKMADQLRSQLKTSDNEQGVAEAGFTKTPSGDYINQHTGVRSSKPPVKKKRGEKTGAEWDAIEKAKKDKDQGVAEGKEDLASLRAKAKEISDKIDAIVKDGGRVGLDDPLSRRLKAIRAKIQQAKKQGVAEGNKKPEPPEADYGPEYQDMVSRVKKLAGLGPLKTVYDPKKRVYRNMPTAVQPKK